MEIQQHRFCACAFDHHPSFEIGLLSDEAQPIHWEWDHTRTRQRGWPKQGPVVQLDFSPAEPPDNHQIE
jgi:hypothetical protein